MLWLGTCVLGDGDVIILGGDINILAGALDYPGRQ